MGNDGGSIPGISKIVFDLQYLGRKDLVKEKAKEIKIDNEIIGKARYLIINFFIEK